MPTKKLPDKDCWTAGKKICRHPEHHPPSMRVYEPGSYEHTCPACGVKTRFTVHGPACGARR